MNIGASPTELLNNLLEALANLFTALIVQFNGLFGNLLGYLVPGSLL